MLLPKPVSKQVLELIARRLRSQQSPWELAIKQLKPDDRKAFDPDDTDKNNTLIGVIEVTNVVRDQCDDKKWKYTKSDGEEVVLRDIVDGLLKRLNKYAVIGDIAIQHNPSVVALAWAGFRFLLQVSN